MTKAELIERIARSRNLPPDITKKDIAAILGIAFEELAMYFAKAKVTRTAAPRFTFPRFGTFTKKKRPARRGVNPRTLEPMQIDASCTVDFKASKELRDQMNGTVVKASKAKTSSRGAAKTATKTKAKAKPKTKSSPASKRPPATKAAAEKRASKISAAKPAKVAPSGRRLTPRDEDAELDALIDDENLFAELPATRLKRVRPEPSDNPRSTEAG
ncbi:MAG: HU family DNA-binding protein [Nannocystaceae bacterium]|nr:HU family DNA-binding protein [Nannocystaceae bacterium]